MIIFGGFKLDNANIVLSNDFYVYEIPFGP